MGIFNKRPAVQTFDIDNSTISVGKYKSRTSNAIIAGNQCPGRANSMLSMIYDAVNNHVPVILIQDGSSISNNSVMSTINGEIPSAVYTYDFLKELYDGGTDLFSGKSNSEKVESLIRLMEAITNPDKDVKEYARLYFSYLYEIADILGDSCTPINPASLKQFSVKWMGYKVTSLLKYKRIDQIKADRLKNFIDVYVPLHPAQSMGVDYFISQLDNYDFSESISKGETLSQKFSQNAVINVILDSARKENYSNALISLFIDAMTKIMTSNPSARLLIMTEEIKVPKYVEFSNLMKLCQRMPGCNFVFTTNDIVKEQEGDHSWQPVGMANTYYIFRQTDPSSREFWAKVSGTHKRTEVSVTRGTNRSAGNTTRGSVSDALFGNRMVVTGQTSTQVDEYNVTENELMALGDNNCILMIMDGGREPFVINLSL